MQKIYKTIKQLRRVDLKELIEFSLKYSLKSIEYDNAQIINIKNQVFAWEIDSLLLMKVFGGTATGNLNPLTELKFYEYANSIREFDYITYAKQQNKTALSLIPIIAANQFTIQIPIINLLYRSLFFYGNTESSFLNDMVLEKFGIDSRTIHQVMVGLYSIAVEYKSDLSKITSTFNKFLENDKIRKVIKTFTINIDSFEELLSRNHKDGIEFVYINYYLKQYCFISIEKEINITYPHNFINTISYGLIYRLTEGNDGYRQKFGKEILENYLYNLCTLNKNFTIVLKSFKYNRTMNETSDVIVTYGLDCLFVESKSSVISKKFRDPSNLTYDLHYIDKYSTSLLQLFKCIDKHNKGEFKINGDSFRMGNCYGVVVNFEDTFIERNPIYESFFEKYSIEFKKEISVDFKVWTYHHLRIIDLTQFENVLIYNVENPISKLFSNKHSDLMYSFDENELEYKEEVTETVTKILDEYINILETFMK